ncbi:fumarylacetoacetate hydrolase family protein [Pseudonocardia asaccharolytica]|uniref:fumarylacetoacetase n=1 Tax=Pseudonocardia asaccharolytica DSM 44247 = NBRC 16224 TaxID=1123024 RepID=A0A511D733_9PSEU|nr:fumarylacetoacetate hydrolase family protein [Pseudonocardia asaccharolytica]GEL20437.1 fumarylacetoacetase [Pseudonocardia asaccharolytica DSM 44247 = NBRC 16224]
MRLGSSGTRPAGTPAQPPLGTALGVVAGSGRPGPSRIAAPVGDTVLDVASLAVAEHGPHAALLQQPNLDGLLAAGRAVWREVVGWLAERLADPDRLSGHLLPATGVVPVLPFTVADYVDFFACEQHAVNAGKIYRPRGEPLAPNWRHLPVGYHGRAGTVVVSGTPVARPAGQRGPGDMGPSGALDVEAEIGYVLGSSRGAAAEPVPLEDALDHVFGVVLLNDWSARDIQAWESRPLGPLLGKSFATSISAWVTPLDELAAAWIDPPPRDPPPLPYLLGPTDRGLDLTLEIWLNGELVSSPPAADLYWTPAQLIAHLTSNGAPLRAGDLLGSGTVSGARREQRGCFLELAWNGAEPVGLADGSARSYLLDGDEVVITATAPAVGGGRLSLGEVQGKILPAR